MADRVDHVLTGLISDAKTYATVGFIFYGLGTFLLLFGIGLVAWLFPYTVGPWDPGFIRGFTPNIPVLVFFLIGFVFLVSLGFTFWAYMTYKRIGEGKHEAARTSALLLGIFGLIFGTFLGGLFFLLAYGKLGEIVHTTHYSAPRGSVDRFCPSCGRVVDPGSQFCANCGAKLPE